MYIADELRNEVITEETLQLIATKLGFEEGLKEDCFHNVHSDHFPIMMILEWEKRMNSKAQKPVLAKSIMEISNTIADDKQSQLLHSLAKKLDIHGKFYTYCVLHFIYQ